MNKSIEQVIDEIKKNNIVMANLLKENVKLAQELEDRPDEEWDWIPLSTASKILNISYPNVFNRYQSGKFKKVRRIGNKIYVSMAEIKQIDDKVGA